jgi:putative transposase
VIYRRGPWRSLEAVEYATLEWVDWFNNRRLLEPIGHVPPAEAEAAYYAGVVDKLCALKDKITVSVLDAEEAEKVR